jgi:hypothetical protein
MEANERVEKQPGNRSGWIIFYFNSRTKIAGFHQRGNLKLAGDIMANGCNELLKPFTGNGFRCIYL